MKTHMVTGPNISGERLHGEVTPDGREVVRLSGPQYSRGENYYSEYASNPSEIVRHLEMNKQRKRIAEYIYRYESISAHELIDAGFDPELINEFFPEIQEA